MAPEALCPIGGGGLIAQGWLGCHAWGRLWPSPAVLKRVACAEKGAGRVLKEALRETTERRETPSSKLILGIKCKH